MKSSHLQKKKRRSHRSLAGGTCNEIFARQYHDPHHQDLWEGPEGDSGRCEQTVVAVEIWGCETHHLMVILGIYGDLW